MATLNTSGTGGIQSKLQSVIGPEPQCCPSLEGKTALVTGGSLGIGYGVAQAVGLNLSATVRRLTMVLQSSSKPALES